MTLRDFIRDNRTELDAVIHRRVPELRLNDREREMWVLNDQDLYLWARREGVEI